MSHTDGTEEDAVEELPFQAVSSQTSTRRDRIYRKLDRSVFAPLSIIWNDLRGKIGLSIVLLYVFAGTVGTRLVDEPQTDVENRLISPFHTWEYPLGTNSSGHGLLELTVQATPAMLKMILAGGIFAVLVGSVIGMVAGYKGGRTDQALMLCTDTLMTIPGLPLVIVLAFLIEPRNPYMIGVLLAINAWTGLARSVRSQVLPLRNIEYVEANRLMGIPLPAILLKDITPNLAPYIAVSFVYASRQIIFDSVALYFLGVLPTNEPNWGIIMDQAYSSGGALYSWGAAHWLLVPMISVVLLSLGFILLAQSADRLFNPRIRARHQKTTTTGDDTAEEGEAESGTTSVGAR